VVYLEETSSVGCNWYKPTNFFDIKSLSNLFNTWIIKCVLLCHDFNFGLLTKIGSTQTKTTQEQANVRLNALGEWKITPRTCGMNSHLESIKSPIFLNLWDKHARGSLSKSIIIYTIEKLLKHIYNEIKFSFWNYELKFMPKRKVESQIKSQMITKP